MFKNVGMSIKVLAKMQMFLGMAISALCGVIIAAVIVANAPNVGLVVAGIFAGIIVSILGAFISWCGSLLVYGFGQLVNNSDIIANQDRT